MIHLLKFFFTLLCIVHCSDETSNGDWSHSKNIIDPYFPSQPKYKVGAILFDDFVMLDLVGPLEVLGDANDKFEIETIGVHSNSTIKPIFQTLSFNNNLSMKEAIQKDWDIIIMPGGHKGTEKLIAYPEFIEDYKKLIAKSKVTFTVCTGSFVLAKTGLINGFKATTNKLLYPKITPLYPGVEWEPNARWVHHRQFITSSGVTAGIDAAFYILALAKNIGEAKKFSKVLEYLPDWDPDNDPFAVNVTNAK